MPTFICGCLLCAHSSCTLSITSCKQYGSCKMRNSQFLLYRNLTEKPTGGTYTRRPSDARCAGLACLCVDVNDEHRNATCSRGRGELQHRVTAVSEEAAEARNKYFRLYRQNFARKFSRVSCNLDVLNRLLLRSDPVITGMRPVPRKKKKSWRKR